MRPWIKYHPDRGSWHIVSTDNGVVIAMCGRICTGAVQAEMPDARTCETCLRSEQKERERAAARERPA